MCNAEEFLVTQTGYWHAAATAGTPMFVTMADVESKPIYEIHKETKVLHSSNVVLDHKRGCTICTKLLSQEEHCETAK
jgi:hypothetical protein